MARKLEQYTPLLREAGELRTGLPAVFESTVAITGVATFTGAPVFTAAPTGPQVRAVNQSALVGATVVLTAADSGKVFVNRSTSGSPSWTLPTLADGLNYTFVCGNTTAGFTVTGAQVIQAKTTATGTAISTTTTLTNTQATAVVGDAITIVGDATSNTWRMIAQTGIFAAS
jgi:hypothetical protein